MNEVETLTLERLNAIRSRLNGVEFHDLEVWEESWPASKGEALIVTLGVGITDAHPDSDNAIFPVGLARLFANAPQDISDLLVEVERLRAERSTTWTREDLENATDAVFLANKPYLDDLAETYEWLRDDYLQHAWARTQARAALRAVNGDMEDE